MAVPGLSRLESGYPAITDIPFHLAPGAVKSQGFFNGMSYPNHEQKQVLGHLHGTLLVLAPAGTGKTRLMADRLAMAIAAGPTASPKPAAATAASPSPTISNTSAPQPH